MAKGKSYRFQSREWTVKDLAEGLRLSTTRVYRLLKENNGDIEAIFESRGIFPKTDEKGFRAGPIDYIGMDFKYPPQPDKDIVGSYLREWQTSDKYKLQEKSLDLLFRSYCPNNNQLEQIILKVSALNDFYSTNIFATFKVAKHILKCNIDKELYDGNEGLVNKIALVTINGKTKNFYSFATKYCNHHNPISYPIYDSYVDKMLMYFKKKDKYDAFLKPNLKEYQRFIEIIKNFRKHYNLESFTLRQIDIYLWLAGKKYFPKNYKKE